MDATQKQISSRIADFRQAAKLNPFDWRIRGASARFMGEIAINVEHIEWKIAARPELIKAIENDNSSADLLLKLIAIDLELGLIPEAQHYYDQFKRVAKASPLIEFVKDLHERQPPPSLPNPDGLEIRP